MEVFRGGGQVCLIMEENNDLALIDKNLLCLKKMQESLKVSVIEIYMHQFSMGFFWKH